MSDKVRTHVGRLLAEFVPPTKPRRRERTSESIDELQSLLNTAKEHFTGAITTRRASAFAIAGRGHALTYYMLATILFDRGQLKKPSRCFVNRSRWTHPSPTPASACPLFLTTSAVMTRRTDFQYSIMKAVKRRAPIKIQPKARGETRRARPYVSDARNVR